MTHSAAIYRVRVRRSRQKDTYLPLGDIDDTGTSLVQVLRNYFSEIKVEDQEKAEALVFLNALTGITADEVGASFEVGEWGLASWLELDAGRSRRRATNPEWVKVGVLANLPPAAEDGLMSIHVPHRRGTKGLLHKELRMRFRDDFPGAVLELTPVIPSNALDEAIKNDRIDQVRLVALERPADRFQDAQKWINKEDLGRIELVLHPRRDRRFAASFFQRFRSNPQLIGEMVQFEGLTFDQAKIRYEYSPGRFRTLNIEKPEAGHAMTIDLAEITLDGDGDPTDASLLEALRAVLLDVAGEA